jgi:hypothetical protein
MTIPEPAPQPLPPKESRSILLVVYHLIALLVMLGMAAFMAFATLVQMTRSIPGVPSLGSPLPNILLVSALGLCGLLLIPPTIQSIQRMNHKPDLPAALPPLRAGVLLFLLAVWIVVAVAAQIIGGIGSAWLLLPPLVILGIGLPVYLLFRIGSGGLGLDSRQRGWGVFGLGLVAGPALAGSVEVAAYLLLLLGGTLFLSMNPEWMATYTRVAAQLGNTSSIDQILTVVAPYLMNPVAIILMLLVVSVFIPLVEEAAKPLGIWLLRKRPPTPQEGFVLGVISGAGFALLESLMAATSSGGSWGVAFLARVGGGIMHILNTGLMGWAIASFWKEHRLGRLARTYGLVVFLHGSWNALTVLTVVGELRLLTSPSQVDPLGSGLVLVSILGLGTLAVAGLLLLIGFNRRMRPAAVPAAAEEMTEPGDAI